MAELLGALGDPAVPFLRYALAAGLLSSVAFGMVGTYVVTRRISYIAGAISHSVLGGIGAAIYLRQEAGLAWLRPMHGAVAAALLSALVVGLVSLHAKEREDTVIGAVWAVGMAAGLLFIAKTAGYIDPMSYLFGNILLIAKNDLWLIAGMDLLVVILGIFFHTRLLAVSFDEEFSELRGIRSSLYFLFLLALTALTIVLLVRVVGIVMVIALLTLPAATAGHFSRRLGQMMLFAVILCALCVTGGLALSYTRDLPTGPVIILIAGAVYILVAAGGRLRRRLTRVG